ncbi:sugar porter family MFS transporter [Niabella drilacis]|uniref:MFS transporter, SP family, arabinose:H+ symporter n=1 Tax=Niabella drilacis (strain DSM 25811 / CCM 8410 / CCUG 62505 / LMG 26954 / E90) TaxID=1285928 RepID=A0A1G6X3L4_NIADE|nr:sugar porter family MFS transporter [Niabella drilacis]SDD72503.1 MFS transporter, SP family, arabinose:H+ symporter [Niabella drilacis]
MADKKFIALTSFVAALGGLLFGFDTAIISGAIPYIKSYFHMDEYILGWSVSSILIGCAVGAMLAGNMADRYGRRAGLIICALLFAVSGIGAGLASQLYLFILFRLVGGLGVGAAAMVSPMYIAEIAPARLRGRLVACYQLAIVFGILAAYFTNYCFSETGPDAWRWMFASQAVPAALFFGLLLLVPETPRWLIMKGRYDAGKEILQKISGAPVPDEEMIRIEDSFRNDNAVTIRQLFRRPYRTVLFVGIIVAVFQQVTGINAIIYYAPTIFKETGGDNASSLMQTIGIGVVNIIATFIAIGLVDKVGRKKLLVTGCLLMGLSMTGVGLCFYFNYFEHYLVLIFMFLYVASFGATLGAVVWVYLAEIFPNRIRSRALSIATLALWLADFAVTLTFPIMTQHLGTAVTMACYAVLCAVAFVYMMVKVKETRGRSLEDIENLFAD